MHTQMIYALQHCLPWFPRSKPTTVCSNLSKISVERAIMEGTTPLVAPSYATICVKTDIITTTRALLDSRLHLLCSMLRRFVAVCRSHALLSSIQTTPPQHLTLFDSRLYVLSPALAHCLSSERPGQRRPHRQRCATQRCRRLARADPSLMGTVVLQSTGFLQCLLGWLNIAFEHCLYIKRPKQLLLGSAYVRMRLNTYTTSKANAASHALSAID
jgi:hypothetical protein